MFSSNRAVALGDCFQNLSLCAFAHVHFRTFGEPMLIVLSEEKLHRRLEVFSSTQICASYTQTFHAACAPTLAADSATTSFQRVSSSINASGLETVSMTPVDSPKMNPMFFPSTSETMWFNSLSSNAEIRSGS